MRKLTKTEIDVQADKLVFRLICSIGSKNAIKVLHIAWIKAREQNKHLRKKYKEIEK